MTGPDELTAPQLRWECDRACLDFATTDEVAPVKGVVGQHSAAQALRFGLQIQAPGQNVFVRGREGTGRLTLTTALAEELRGERSARPDRVLVHNFAEPNRPSLLELETGSAPAFEALVRDLSRFIRTELAPALQSEDLQARVAQVNTVAQDEMRALSEPFDKELADAGLTLVIPEGGDPAQPVIAPMVDGEPIAGPQFQQMVAAGKLKEADIAKLREQAQSFQPKLREVTAKAHELRRQTARTVAELVEEEVRALVGGAMQELRRAYPGDDVVTWTDGLTDALVARRGRVDDAGDLERALKVNILSSRHPGDPAPIVVDNAPTAASLLGSIDVTVLPDGNAVADHLSVRPGTLIQADGGYLVAEASDILAEPGAWRALIRTLRAASLDWERPERGGVPTPLLRPEAVPLEVRVVLLGSPELYAFVDATDHEFGELFKVLADFDTVIDRNDDGVRMYAAVIARIAADEGLPPFDTTAVAALVGHGARIAAQEGKLTARFGRLGDIVREAAFVARQAGADVVTEADVVETVRRTKARAGLPGRKFRESVRRGTLRISVEGTAVGQVNGLAVMSAGPLTYGFPTRISATVGPGDRGTVNIEGEAALSGSIHTKGFHILGGLLRTLLPTRHPAAFDASITFEQSYGGIDGDSASGAEAVAMLSALTGLPIRQGLAMTGAIDQHGHLLPIGAQNEKIEGFFDLCDSLGLTGTQGVLLPRANVGGLMLRSDVVQAVADGRFHVYAADRIHDALALMLDTPAGELGDDGTYPADSVLGIAMGRLAELWEMADRQGSR